MCWALTYFESAHHIIQLGLSKWSHIFKQWKIEGGGYKSSSSASHWMPFTYAFLLKIWCAISCASSQHFRPLTSPPFVHNFCLLVLVVLFVVILPPAFFTSLHQICSVFHDADSSWHSWIFFNEKLWTWKGETELAVVASHTCNGSNYEIDYFLSQQKWMRSSLPAPKMKDVSTVITQTK